MCASGKYESVTQSGTKTIQAENFTRSAIAPLIRAAVMTAKVSWKRHEDVAVGTDAVEAEERRTGWRKTVPMSCGPKDIDQPQSM